MTARAKVHFDESTFGVRLAVSPRENQVVIWPATFLTVQQMDERESAPDEAFLRLDEEIARAIYEALGDFFGHAGHDIRALRKDYEAERKRVDLFIAKAVGV